MEEKTQRLFVYGSLCPGNTNQHILKGIGGTFQRAFVSGYLKNEGWGAEMGFPGILLDSSGDLVDGYVFSSVHLEDKWDDLDVFEGEEYKRLLTHVTLDNGETVEAFIYVLA